jgi:hypothetical protein
MHGKNLKDMEEGLKRITSLEDPSFIKDAPIITKYPNDGSLRNRALKWF